MPTAHLTLPVRRPASSPSSGQRLPWPPSTVSLVTAWTTGSPDPTPDPLPVFTRWPSYGHIEPEEQERDKPEPDDDGVHVPCASWFFFFCISWGQVRVRSWCWILPPGIYGPMPPPTNIIHPPPGVTLRGNLPNWPKFTIGPDRQLTTESEPDCEKQTAEACTTTNYVSDDVTTSSTTLCETITGCSITVSDETTDVIGDQTAAPIGTWIEELWATQTLGEDWTIQAFAALRSEMSREKSIAGGTTISLTSGSTARPTCADGTTACGGTICSGYSCQPTPTGPPPGFHDPKDPNSDDYLAPTTTISSTTSDDPKPTTPLERGPIQCFDEADFPGHGDINPDSQDDLSTEFSNLRGGVADDSIGPGSSPWELRKKDGHGINYWFKAEWVAGYVTTVDKQSFGFPLGSPSLITAYLLVRENFTKCNNQGVGGTCQVGCLKYTFEGGRGDAEEDPCKDFDCRQCGAPFEVPECQTCCR